MPIYTYACDRCEDEFEVEQRITEDPLAVHSEIAEAPDCPGVLKRLIGAGIGVNFKGGGWTGRFH